MRLRRTAALALTLVTGIGGHYLNRRPDRALFFGLLFLAGMFFGNLISPRDFQPWGEVLPVAPLWLLSIAFTWRDARTGAPLPVHPSSWMGKAGAAALTLVCAAVLYIAAGTLLEALTLGYRVRDVFAHTFLLGGPGRYQGTQHAVLPQGPGHLELEFTYAGRPLAKLQFVIVLDNRYWVNGLITGPDGMARVAMPPGKWRLTEVITYDLEQRPEELGATSDVVLISGREPTLGDPRQPYSPEILGGLPFEVAETGPATRLKLSLAPAPRLIWPSRGHELVATANLKNEICWEPVEQAVSYQIVLFAHRGYSYERTAVRAATVEGATCLPLAALGPTEGAADTSYSVTVSAFSKGGSYLGHTHSLTQFTLSDAVHFAPPPLP